jgi:hypothetical protein
MLHIVIYHRHIVKVYMGCGSIDAGKKIGRHIFDIGCVIGEAIADIFYV